MKKRSKQDPNLAKKRNFAKFRLAGMRSSLRSICGDIRYLKAPLLEEERAALNSIFDGLTVVLEQWDKNYKKLKERSNNEGEA